MALLGAQALAGLSVTGIPLAGSRSLTDVKQQAQVIAEQIWNTALKPHIAKALSSKF